MLTYHRTSLLESDAQTIVNTVNTVGVMGKGLAAALKSREPDMFKAYKRICDQKLLDVGKLWLWRSPEQWVLNFPTKAHWRNPSKLDYIRLGLDKFVSSYEEKGIREIAFPRLGCGNGGLDWDIVRPMMQSYLEPLPIRVYIHDYSVDLNLPEHKEYSPEYVENSFHDFMVDVQYAIELNGGVFNTVDGRSEFKAKLTYEDDEYKINMAGGDWSAIVDEFDMSELWSLLNKGPVDRGRLVGLARDFSAPLFSILSTIDYIRLIEVAAADHKESAVAIERKRRLFSTGLVSA